MVHSVESWEIRIKFLANKLTPPCMTIDGIGGLMNVKYTQRKEWRCNDDGHVIFFTEETEFYKQLREQNQDWTEPLERAVFAALFDRPLVRIIFVCIFCVSDDASALSPIQLPRHLAWHLEALALRILPEFNMDNYETFPGNPDSDADTGKSKKQDSNANINFSERRSNAGSVT